MPVVEIIRIVKMQFKPEHLPRFLTHFGTVKQAIRTFPGCKGLTLLQDAATTGIIFTYSKWQSAEDLEAYRQSELFRNTWVFVKTLFATPAEAWTVNELQQL